MASTIRDPAIQHWAGKARSLLNERWLKRAFAAARKRDRSKMRLNEGDLTNDLDLAFDGAENVLRHWRRGIRPDPNLTVSYRADAHRKLTSRASAEPGQYRTARTPYLRAIMDALSTQPPSAACDAHEAAQISATEAGNNWTGFVIHTARGPMRAVQPTLEMALLHKSA